MSTTLSASFDTRRDAEMTIERLVQEYGIERTDIFVTTEGDDNSVGEAEAGSDTEAGQPSPEDRDDAALNGRITLSVDIEDDTLAEQVRAAARESEAIGTLGQSRPDVGNMFEDVYKTEDWRLTAQRQEVGV